MKFITEGMGTSEFKVSQILNLLIILAGGFGFVSPEVVVAAISVIQGTYNIGRSIVKRPPHNPALAKAIDELLKRA